MTFKFPWCSSRVIFLTYSLYYDSCLTKTLQFFPFDIQKELSNFLISVPTVAEEQKRINVCIPKFLGCSPKKSTTCMKFL
jgi:hypothetical protein